MDQLVKDINCYRRARRDASAAGESAVVCWLSKHVDVAAWVHHHWNMSEDIPDSSLLNSDVRLRYLCSCAVQEGEIEVIKRLFSGIPATDFFNEWPLGPSLCLPCDCAAPLLAICFDGALKKRHIEVAKWIFHRTQVRGETLDLYRAMAASCFECDLQNVQWLVEVGPSDILRPSEMYAKTPLCIAASQGHTLHHAKVVLWLVLRGAANDETDHVDIIRLNNDVSVVHANARSLLVRNLATLIFEHFLFVTTIYALKKQNLNETGILAHVADFIGVLRGKEFRVAREAFVALGGM